MNHLISVNRKFMEISPERLTEMIAASNFAKGLELYVDIHNKSELKYLADLIPKLKSRDLILQIHGESELPLAEQLDFLHTLENYSDDLGQKIVITLHPLIDKTNEETADYLDNVIKNTDPSKLTICLENLIGEHNKSFVEPIILDNNSLSFTYDIGHEIADFGAMIAPGSTLTNKIHNVHFHTNNLPPSDSADATTISTNKALLNTDTDHKPIYENDKHWHKLQEALDFLAKVNYQLGIVYEYDLYACHGTTTAEKIKSYLDSIDFVASKLML